MKILVIAEEVGKTATGIVVQKLISGLSQSAEVHLFCGDCFLEDSEINFKIFRQTFHHEKPQTNHRYYIIFKTDIRNLGWGWKFLPQFNGYDLILSVVSYGHYLPLSIAKKISSSYGTTSFVYFVDAIPAPFPYLVNNHLRKSVLTHVRHKLTYTKAVFSTCQEMSDYQRSILNLPHIKYAELYNPGNRRDIQHYDNSDTGFTFTYTGQIYNPRNPSYLLEAFKLFVKDNPEARLCFVGTILIREYLEEHYPELMPVISVLDYQSDLTEVYKHSSCLVDISCEVDPDIYMSSKMVNYFSIDRPILSESSMQSPVRRIFGNIKSVFHCSHSTQSVYEAMCRIKETASSIDYADRKQLISDFSIESVVGRLLDVYKSL